MKDSELQLIGVEQLQIGMFVHLDLGWTDHPFPFNSFKIRSVEQLQTLRSLGIDRIRYSPGRSDAQAPAEPARLQVVDAHGTPEPAAAAESAEVLHRRQRREQLQQQIASLERCERQFSQASRGFRQTLHLVRGQPELARAEAEQVIGSMLSEMTGEQDVAIRLLSEKAGEETALHSLNTTVLALLLARACGVHEELADIGLGALLHDVGKLELPDRLRWRDQNFTVAERKMFQEHVAHGIVLAERMCLPELARQIIAQHHEQADGGGYPLGLRGEQIHPAATIVSLVNQYDNLCNPGNPASALTPHDALAVMFARMRGQFDPATMAIFIRMMGVYPPGSTVQLTDGRYALSVSVNAARPLKPRVIVHDPAVPSDDALVVDLELHEDLGVQRSLKPAHLPRAVYDYLSPRKRMCYFFERSREGECGMAA